MATTITIIIQGIILFVSSGVYGVGEEPRNTGAAIAIHSDGRMGSYDVMLPDHKPQLILVASEVATSPMPALFRRDANDYVADLAGHRIQVGIVTNGVCTGMTGAGATGDLAAMNVPDISKLGLDSTVIDDNARPTSANDYKDIDPDRVAAWLEMRDGALTTEGQSDMVAEFRPATDVQFNPIQRVQWRTPNAAPCLIVTPFGGAPVYVVFKPTVSPVVRYENRPVVAGGGHRHGRAFASYDFELLYDVLDKKPDIPPVPHQLFLDAIVHGEAPFLRDCVKACTAASSPNTDPVTGLNCGPGTNPTPGSPHP